MSRFVLRKQNFYDQADALRAVFDERFAEPRSTRGDRFAWDWWHVPDQYTLLRTPAWEYFPEELYADFHERLALWGRAQLGCWDLSPPWLSVYIDGCEQQLHADVPHGPWAFVLTLNPKGRRAFQGGETLIAKPELLDYWSGFDGAEDRERGSFVATIPPRFNQLTVFDPRFPHGVTRVSGTRDPREGRLAIHGWFTEPRPFIEGPLTDLEVEQGLAAALESLPSMLAELGVFHGLLSMRLEVEADGQVRAARTLANTLVGLDAPGVEESGATRRIVARLKRARFAASSEPSGITLPLLFR